LLRGIMERNPQELRGKPRFLAGCGKSRSLSLRGAERRSNLVFLTRKPECPAPAPALQKLHSPGRGRGIAPFPRSARGQAVARNDNFLVFPHPATSFANEESGEKITAYSRLNLLTIRQ
jgi:hypothetical protein